MYLRHYHTRALIICHRYFMHNMYNYVYIALYIRNNYKNIINREFLHVGIHGNSPPLL